jgi:hypothetical protein
MKLFHAFKGIAQKPMNIVLGLNAPKKLRLAFALYGFAMLLWLIQTIYVSQLFLGTPPADFVMLVVVIYTFIFFAFLFGIAKRKRWVRTGALIVFLFIFFPGLLLRAVPVLFAVLGFTNNEPSLALLFPFILSTAMLVILCAAFTLLFSKENETWFR